MLELKLRVKDEIREWDSWFSNFVLLHATEHSSKKSAEEFFRNELEKWALNRVYASEFIKSVQNIKVMFTTNGFIGTATWELNTQESLGYNWSCYARK